MVKLGAHMSIAGGYYKAIEAGVAVGCDCVQLFTKNNNQWRAKPITDDDVEKFKAAVAKHKIQHVVSHASYLINLASPNDELRNKSIDAMVIELQRAELLGIPGVVMHPGSYTTSSEAAGIAAIARSINEIHQKIGPCDSQILLENVAGQGTNIGWKWEHLAEIIEQVDEHERLGVCIDTCHAFAAGYPLSPAKDFKKTVASLNKWVGIDRVKAIHLNDSKKPLGSRRDRHEHIGRGEMGLEPFRLLLNHHRLKKIPMYLETAKGQEDGRDLDAINLETLRGLVGQTEPIAPKKSTPRQLKF